MNRSGREPALMQLTFLGESGQIKKHGISRKDNNMKK